MAQGGYPAEARGKAEKALTVFKEFSNKVASKVRGISADDVLGGREPLSVRVFRGKRLQRRGLLLRPEEGREVVRD